MDHQTSSIPPIPYNSPQSSTQPMTEFPQMDSGLVVHVFTQGDDPIVCLNMAMAFLATIQDGRVTVQQVQGRQGQSYASTGYKGNDTSSGGNNTNGHARVVKCYNCQGEGHMVLDLVLCKVMVINIPKPCISLDNVPGNSISKLWALKPIRYQARPWKPI
ncbi:hypothetical protein Tco_1138203 [Tanacetum coccineum]